MRVRTLSVSLLATSTSLFVFVACNSRTSSSHNSSSPPEADDVIQISPERIPIPPVQLSLCLAPRNGPHQVPEILLHANSIAIEYRRQNPNKFDYPVGAKFVKEKFSAPDQKQPDAATIMTRTEVTGKISDWEFTSVSLPARTPLTSPNDPSCIGCHQGFADRGFVSQETEDALQRYLKLE
jgi:hypothetical protein